jgi:DNA-binding NarL/FixJ family response regulator
METIGQTSTERTQGRRHATTKHSAATSSRDRTYSKYNLSEREFAVLELLSQGNSDKEIAFDLRVTAYTVNKHVGAILVKMNVRSRTAAAVHAIREHLFDDPPATKALRPTA